MSENARLADYRRLKGYRYLYASTVGKGAATRLCCNACGKSVSTLFQPVPTETPDGGLIVRAFIQCPECLEAERP